MFTPAILFYDAVVAVHVMSIVIAFGVTFAYPVIVPWMISRHPQSVAALHEMQVRVGHLVITPFATLALFTGIYLASDHDYFSKTWVTIPMVILIVLLGLGGAFFTPREKELADLARRDMADGGALSPEYAARARVVGMVGALTSVLVLVAIFLMITKP